MISVVIPIYNERENIAPLAEEIHAALKKRVPYEIIFVDDGSSDGSDRELKRIKGITAIFLRRNFGQSTALAAGIDHAKGDIIVTLDGDRQNDPKDIPLLLDKIDEGYDIVSGWRHRRKDPLFKRIFSNMARAWRNLLIKDRIHDAGCALKAYRKECFDGFELFGELHRYIVELLAIKGFRVAEVKVSHRPRTKGTTKYGAQRLVKGMLDLYLVWFWQKYAGRPLHLFGGLGIMCVGAGFLTGIMLVLQKILFSRDLSDNFFSVVVVFLLLAGIQLFVAGVMTDLLVRTHNKDRRRYWVREITKS